MRKSNKFSNQPLSILLRRNCLPLNYFQSRICSYFKLMLDTLLCFGNGSWRSSPDLQPGLKVVPSSREPSRSCPSLDTFSVSGIVIPKISFWTRRLVQPCMLTSIVFLKRYYISCERLICRAKASRNPRGFLSV